MTISRILRVDLYVVDFTAWKKSFDRNLIDREESGVRRYRVIRSIDDPKHIMVDLEFDNPGKMEAFLTAVRSLMAMSEMEKIENSLLEVAETVESKEY